jgi:predicted RNase H-like nuclease
MGDITWIAGIDGFKGGWCVVLCNIDTGEWAVRFESSFAATLALPQEPVVICVDMPIGLHEHTPAGGRDCERMARRALGARRSSVFSAVGRQALACATRAEAHSLSRASSGIGIGAQAWGLATKLREVDATMTVERQKIVFEVHPELCFWAMNNRAPMAHAKKTPAGEADRIAALRQNGIPVAFVDRELGLARGRRDDFLDACAAAWTARRIRERAAERLPKTPQLDARGLDMAIWV